MSEYVYKSKGTKGMVVRLVAMVFLLLLAMSVAFLRIVPSNNTTYAGTTTTGRNLAPAAVRNNNNNNRQLSLSLPKLVAFRSEENAEGRGWEKFRDPKSVVFKPIVFPEDVIDKQAASLALEEAYQLDSGKQLYMQISRLNKLVYVHIPKAGGTTIESSSLFQDHRFYTGRPASSHHTITSMMQNASERRLLDFVTATTIRHPGLRFASAFYYLKYDPIASKADDPTFLRHTTRFKMDQVDSIEAFVTMLDDTKDMWEDLLNTFPHFQPMTSWVLFEKPSNREFGVDVVMCQEQWNEGLDRLSRALHRELPEDLFDRAQNSNQYVQVESIWNSLPQHTRNSVMKAYALDVCLFGYDDVYRPKGMTEDMCIGSVRTRHDFTEQYQWCRQELNIL